MVYFLPPLPHKLVEGNPLFNNVKKSALLGAAALQCCANANATPLSMDYVVTDIGGGTYQYDFTLTLDNNDGSWVAIR